MTKLIDHIENKDELIKNMALLRYPYYELIVTAYLKGKEEKHYNVITVSDEMLRDENDNSYESVMEFFMRSKAQPEKIINIVFSEDLTERKFGINPELVEAED